MEAPIAALAVARMIAIAATSTRSEREIASLVFLDIRLVTLFGSLISLGLCGLVYFALARIAPLRRSMRSGYFNQAVSIARDPQKFRTVPSTLWAACAPQKTNRQTKNFINVTGRHKQPKNTGFSYAVRIRIKRRCDSFARLPGPPQDVQLEPGMVNRTRN